MLSIWPGDSSMLVATTGHGTAVHGALAGREQVDGKVNEPNGRKPIRYRLDVPQLKAECLEGMCSICWNMNSMHGKGLTCHVVPW